MEDAGIDVRPVVASELGTYARLLQAVFNEPEWPDVDTALAREIDFERTFVAVAGDQIVGTCGVYNMEITLPGGGLEPCAGVTFVGVLPTHRRRGILVRMMRTMLDQARDRGESVAALWASEATIYGRFGYGVATRSPQYDIERARAQLAPWAAAAGELRWLTAEEASAYLPGLYDRLRRSRPGMVTKPDPIWTTTFMDQEGWRLGWSSMKWVIHEDASGPDGYVTFRTRDEDLKVEELVALSPEAERALWRLVLSMDLIKAPHCDPLNVLPEMLVDHRAVTETWKRCLWVRLLDIPAALTRRGYTGAGELILEVEDAFYPDLAGRYQLTVSSTGSNCVRTDRPAALAMDTAQLGRLWMGGMRASTLARAGGLRELRPGAAHEADQIFAWPVPPWCNWVF